MELEAGGKDHTPLGLKLLVKATMVLLLRTQALRSRPVLGGWPQVRRVTWA